MIYKIQVVQFRTSSPQKMHALAPDSSYPGAGCPATDKLVQIPVDRQSLSEEVMTGHVELPSIPPGKHYHLCP